MPPQQGPRDGTNNDDEDDVSIGSSQHSAGPRAHQGGMRRVVSSVQISASDGTSGSASEYRVRKSSLIG